MRVFMAVLNVSLCLSFSLMVSPRPLMAQRGGGTVPPVGTPLPNVTVYDADGNEFPFRQLQGEYSVVVFGCLT